MESIRVRRTPSERLSTFSYGLMTFFSVFYEQELHMSDEINSCPMESIGTSFDHFFRLDDIFLSVSRTETPHVRWNLFVSDGTPTIGVLFTDRLPVFQWKANDIRWSLVDSIGQPSGETGSIYGFSKVRRSHLMQMSTKTLRVSPARARTLDIPHDSVVPNQLS